MQDLPKWAKPAGWMKHAVATNRGWVNEKTGELYKNKRQLKDRIDALSPAPAPKVVASAPKVDTPKKKVAKKKSDD